jgi:NADH-quinone oxidoreductase subunit G
MATIYIDNASYEVNERQNLLHQCLSLGFNLPYFCWHPELGSVGSCRQCAVKQYKDENDTHGRIVMACMTPSTDGAHISIKDPEATSFRKSIIEWLMINHPHDCPVCEEGGECHLQDMTLMTGQVYRRYRFKKRTFRNQDLGPFINHEMNRCITCYRCVRFYADYAGGHDLQALGIHDAVYFGRTQDGVLENEFSGNLAEVCPTGVFTDKTFGEKYARKWDLQTAPSVCMHCGVGCNTSPNERDGNLRRIVNRYNDAVNGYFICDRGRFGYDFINSKIRIRQPLLQNIDEAQTSEALPGPAERPSTGIREDRTGHNTGKNGRALRASIPPALYNSAFLRAGDMHPCMPVRPQDNAAKSHSHQGEGILTGAGENWIALAKEQALDHLRHLLANPRAVIGIGSARASIESNFALRKLVGAEHFYSGMSSRDQRLVNLILDIYTKGPARAASVHDAEQADAVLVLGEDVSNTAPRLGLSLRQAIRHKAWDLAAAQDIPRWLDNSVRDAAQNQQSPMFIVTPDVTRLDDVGTHTYHAAPDEIARLGFAVAHELNGGAPSVADLTDELKDFAQLIARTLRQAKRPLVVSGMGCRNEAVVQAAANIAWVLSGEARAADLCLVMPESNSLGLGLIGGGELDQALGALSEGSVDTVIVLENDLYRCAERPKVDAALNTAAHIVVIDHLWNNTTPHAELVLPAGTFAESDGTLVNFEGRAQRFFQVMEPRGDVRESWRWLTEAANRSWPALDDVIAACTEEMLALRGIEHAAPPASFRIAGQKIPRAPHRYSGRTAMMANVSIHEPKPSVDNDTPLSFSMEGYHGRAEPPATIPLFWAPGWNSNEALNKFQDEVGGLLHGGNSGVRLIEAPADARAEYFDIVPAAFKAYVGTSSKEMLFVPLHHVFGSEELSVEAQALAARVPLPYVALNPDDAARLNIRNGDPAEVSINNEARRLSVMLRPALAAGLAGLPWNFRGMDYLDLPAWGGIRKAAST